MRLLGNRCPTLFLNQPEAGENSDAHGEPSVQEIELRSPRMWKGFTYESERKSSVEIPGALLEGSLVRSFSGANLSDL